MYLDESSYRAVLDLLFKAEDILRKGGLACRPALHLVAEAVEKVSLTQFTDEILYEMHLEARNQTWADYFGEDA